MGDLIHGSREDRRRRQQREGRDAAEALAAIKAREAQGERAIIRNDALRAAGRLPPLDEVEIGRRAALTSEQASMCAMWAASDAIEANRLRVEETKRADAMQDALERLSEQLREMYEAAHGAAKKRAKDARAAKERKSAATVTPGVRKRIEGFARRDGLGARKIHARFLAEFERDEWPLYPEAPPSVAEIEKVLREMKAKSLGKKT